jgi:hypothetical protein
VADAVGQARSNPDITVVSEQEIVLLSGQPGIRMEVVSMGPSIALFTEVNGRTVVLTCFGEFEPFDEIASTLGEADVVEGAPPPVTGPAAALNQYQDSEAGVSVLLPEDWVVTGIVPGQRATLQSYPENKYVGGEAFQPGDTKCDLSIRPPEVSAVDFVEQMRSNDAVSIVSEEGVILQSGEPGTRIELESMGRSLLLVTEVDRRVVVLTCFGEFAPFDQIAGTLGAIE